MGFFGIIFAIAIVVVLDQLKKGQPKDTREGKNPERIRRDYPQRNAQGNRNKKAASPFAGASKSSGRPSCFVREFGTGITFKELRPGTDELEYLMQRNAIHERELENRLVSKER